MWAMESSISRMIHARRRRETQNEELTLYESPDIALNCGIMLRECIRHEPLAKITLCSEEFYDFFRYVEMSTFDIASDAFATFKVNQWNRSADATGESCCISSEN
ncbi:hypothetical protein XENOCAPTIV_007261 [Xenoophorus captivus]|uniref:Uncharacterized protein n=1 Tax=Xenoophorus captivus TaxID=1517983 RepID=A0ABV0S5X6_9TELE